MGAMGFTASSPLKEDPSSDLTFPVPVSGAEGLEEDSSAGLIALPVCLPSTGVLKSSDTSTSTKQLERHPGPVQEPLRASPNPLQHEGSVLLLSPDTKTNKDQGSTLRPAGPSTDSIGFEPSALQPDTLEQLAAAHRVRPLSGRRPAG